MNEILQTAGAELGVVLKTAYAMVLGGVIGWERELKNRPAGFRTHMLVCGAAALLVGLADLIAVHFSAEAYRELVRVDPLRLIEAVVAAVGFLGAGAIFRRGDGDNVSGITTAASMLMVAVLGIAAGLGTYVLALGATLLTLAVLLVLQLMEKRTAGARSPQEPRDPPR